MSESAASHDRSPLHAGGCQCGAVRFAVYASPDKVGLCHCRMCQKAVAGPFAVLAEVPLGQFSWTRGSPATFRSSTRAVRDFCSACGTPLSYRHPEGHIIELLTGAFDEPARVAPTYENGTESRLAWLSSLPALADNGPTKPVQIESFQHPDHDTGPGWRPAQ